MEKRFWIIVGIIAVVFIGILYVSSNNKSGSNTNAVGQPTNHIKGKTDSKVTFVEYGDFQCPVCGAYYPIVTQVMAKYQDRVKFQFRNLPLSQVHQNAFAGARAAEAASNQGKFWEMYDLLFTNQQTWSTASNPESYFTQYAQQLGLNASKFSTDFASDQVNKSVNADLDAFKKTGQQMATPTFFLNGKPLNLQDLSNTTTGPTLDSFSKIIDAELKKQGA